MSTKNTVLLLTLLLFPTALQAQELKALVGGRLIDGFGHQPIANSVILIKDDRIEKGGTLYKQDGQIIESAL